MQLEKALQKSIGQDYLQHTLLQRPAHDQYMTELAGLRAKVAQTSVPASVIVAQNRVRRDHNHANSVNF